MTDIQAEPDVQRLTGGEGGRWWIVARQERYLFDLNVGTVTWFPRRDLRPGDRGHSTLIAAIHVCAVGAPGEWALHEGPPDARIGHWWIHTTPIERIIRIPDRPAPKGQR